MPPRFPWFRRVAVPVLLPLAALVGLALPRLWEAADLDPAPRFALDMGGRVLCLLCVLYFPFWLFAQSGLRWRTKVLVVAGVLLPAVAFAACVRKVVPDGNLMPRFTFRWEPRPEASRAARRESPGDDLPPIDLTVDPASDFPRYRGIRADGVAAGRGLADWTTSPPRLLYRQPCVGGFAGFAVAGNVAVTVEQHGKDEAVVCYDRATGRRRWVCAYPASFEHLMGDGPRATPAIDEGDVFSLGGLGDLVCVEGRTGRQRWAVNVLADCGARNVTWGMSGSPLVVDGLVVLNPGIDPDANRKMAVAAYDRTTGERVWAAGEHPAGYSSPQLATLAGRRQVLLFDGGGLVGLDPATGRELWRYPWKTFQDMNIIQPLVLDGDRVLISSEGSNGCATVKVVRDAGGFRAEKVWANRLLGAKFANPVRVGGAVYGLSNGTLVCLDAETGRRLWRGPYHGHGQLLAAGESLVILSEKGYLVQVAADPGRYRELGRVEVFADRTWNTPALAGRHLFVRNDQEMACFELGVR